MHHDWVDLRSDDGDGETGSVEAADGAEGCRVGVLLALAAETVLGVFWAVAERRVDVASARRRAVTGENGDGDHGAAAEDVENYAEESEDGLAAQAAREQDGEDGVENHAARHASHGLLPYRDGAIAIGLDGEKVAVDAEDDAGAAEFERVQDARRNLEDRSADRHCRMRIRREEDDR